MAKIKICGLIRPEDIAAANSCRPDYIGFVFAKHSRRYVDAAQAARLKRSLRADIAAVGVFVNEPPDNIARLLADKVIDIAQLHGQETEEDVRMLKRKTGCPVIKAVSVENREDIVRWQDSQADYLLFDNGAGGSGQSFDWSVLRAAKKPFFLAGGIRRENIAQALLYGAYALDVSGGAETDGVKDAAKMAQLVRAVRGDVMRVS